jgi:hypothetical protein
MPIQFDDLKLRKMLNEAILTYDEWAEDAVYNTGIGTEPVKYEAYNPATSDITTATNPLWRNTSENLRKKISDSQARETANMQRHWNEMVRHFQGNKLRVIADDVQDVDFDE